MKGLLVILMLVLTSYAVAAQEIIKLNFSPESEKYLDATKEYQDIWSKEGKRIVEAMESISGLRFTDKEVRAIVYEGVSWSGSRSEPMKLRASYTSDVKKATVVHELGHRLIFSISKTKEIDEHRALFLILYDIWESLYGKDFADKKVKVEKGRKGLYDYESAWNWALSISKEERAAKFKMLRESSIKDKDSN